MEKFKRMPRDLNERFEVVEFACGIPQLLKGEFTENVGTNVDIGLETASRSLCWNYTFNFPAMVPMWMFLLQ